MVRRMVFAGKNLLAGGELGLGARVFDGLLDGFFNLIPVPGINAVDLAKEMLLDLAQHIPLVGV